MTSFAESSNKVLALSLIGKALGFRDCKQLTLTTLINEGQLHTYGRGEAIVRKGSPFDVLCLVVRGSVETSINPKDGHRHLISFLQPGDVAGVIGVVDRLGHVNDLIARERGTVILRMPGDLVRSLRERDPKLVHALELQLAFRSRLLYELLDTRPRKELASRLARVITVLARMYGTETKVGTTLGLKMSQADFADMTGVTRQRVNYALKALRDQGLISMAYSTITVPDTGKLELFANG